jgi:class 3 adenylate cyclase/tetratricopeptide (TPR) repeat protein
VVCTNCGTENEAGRKFCKECAARLAFTCAACGAANAADAKFCGECASPLTDAPARLGSSASGERRPPIGGFGPDTPGGSGGSAPVTERRLVSVLFADLVGFTPFAEERDAEDVRATLDRYFELATDVIGRYGGTIEKFIGDAVMALWGAPVAREDDAERAVRAGLELVESVRTLGPPIEARAGVLTGEAAVTLGASNQGLVAGDLVNTAARLQSVAAPGIVLVGEATQRAAGRAIAFEPAGEQRLKGKEAPVPAWRALRVVAQVGGRNRREALEAPFVGRTEELRQLKELFHTTTRDHRARLVSVIGPAGIGKTRLAWEFLKYVDGLVESVRWHDGRSPAYGDGISFWALGEMVRERCRLLETDDEATTRSKVAETVAKRVPDPDERRWIEPALLALLGVERDVGGAEQLFAAWRTFFERLAADAPVVMVFEDFHYADPGLLDFVDHLLEWSRAVPIYVLTLARPELLEKRPDWGTGKRNFTSLYLDPLPPAAMRELLAGLVPGLPAAAVAAIVARADGVPLYAVETVRMLLAEGKLEQRDDTYVPVGDLTDLAVPETLTALIASRLDRLAPEDRALVSDAAVLGQSFSLAGLSAVSGIEPAELEPRLRTLVRRELLRVEADPRSPERGQYVFVQALIREVAYHTLARSERKIRHLAAARFFESLGSDELAGALAGQYLAAHAAAPDGPEAEALAAQARLALRAAATRAVALGSPGQAVTFLRQAMTVVEDPAEEAELRELAGRAASAAAHHDEAEELLHRAVDLYRGAGDRVATARATAALGDALLLAYRTEQALGILEPAAEEFADLPDDPGYVAVLAQLARACMLTERYERAVAVADRALPSAERADLTALVADLLVTKGTALGARGRPYEGLGVVETGQRLAEQRGFAATALRGRINHGYLRSKIDARAAGESDRIGLTEARRLGLRRQALLFLTNWAADAVWTGDWDQAETELREALAGDLEREDRFLVVGRLGNLLAFRGERIDDVLDEMERLIGASPDPNYARFLIEVRTTSAFARGEHDEAVAGFRNLARTDTGNARTYLILAARAALLEGDTASAVTDLEALHETGVHGRWTDANRASIRAGIAALEGRQAEALALYQEALRGFEEVGVPLDGALTSLEMASLLDGSRPEVGAVIDAARAFLERVRARSLLERLDRAAGRASVVATDGDPRSPAPASRPSVEAGS